MDMTREVVFLNLIGFIESSDGLMMTDSLLPPKQKGSIQAPIQRDPSIVDVADYRGRRIPGQRRPQPMEASFGVRRHSVSMMVLCIVKHIEWEIEIRVRVYIEHLFRTELGEAHAEADFRPPPTAEKTQSEIPPGLKIHNRVRFTILDARFGKLRRFVERAESARVDYTAGRLEGNKMRGERRLLVFCRATAGSSVTDRGREIP